MALRKQAGGYNNLSWRYMLVDDNPDVTKTSNINTVEHFYKEWKSLPQNQNTPITSFCWHSFLQSIFFILPLVRDQIVYSETCL